MTQKHRSDRLNLKSDHDKRWQQEELKRNERMRKGFKGLWDKLTGTYQRTKAKNEKETKNCQLRDQQEKEKLIASQLGERKKLQVQFETIRKQHTDERNQFIKGMDKHYQKIDRQAEIRKLYEQEKDHIKRSINNDPDYEPEI